MSAPLRVLCVLPDVGGGGAERVMLYIARALDRERFRVTLALGRLRGPYLPMIPEDIEVLEFGTDSGRAAVIHLARILRERRHDLCFSMVQMNPAALLARMIARSEIPVAISARNHYSRSLRAEATSARAKAVAVRLLYPRANRVLCVSAGVRDDLVAHFGVPAERTEVIHNPIEIDRVRALALEDPGHTWFAHGATVPVAVAVGKLMEAKGYPNLLRAFRRVRDQVPARLIILGDGPLRDATLADIVRLGLGDDVALVGFRENPYAFLSRAAVLMHAAHWEGFPNVLVEAMACGTPVVSTDCPSGPAEIITDGEDGFLVPVGDAQRLADRTLDLLRDAALRERVVRAASERVLAFTASHIVERYAVSFADLAGTRRPTA